MGKKYLTNKELYIEIVYSKAKGRLTPEAQRMLYLLAKNVHRKFYYRNVEDKEDCLQGAMLDVLKFWYNYNEIKSNNAFAYYSEVIKRGHAKTWNKLLKHREDVSINQFFDTDGDLNF